MISLFFLFAWNQQQKLNSCQGPDVIPFPSWIAGRVAIWFGKMARLMLDLTAPISMGWAKGPGMSGRGCSGDVGRVFFGGLWSAGGSCKWASYSPLVSIYLRHGLFNWPRVSRALRGRVMIPGMRLEHRSGGVFWPSFQEVTLWKVMVFGSFFCVEKSRVRDWWVNQWINACC